MYLERYKAKPNCIIKFLGNVHINSKPGQLLEVRFAKRKRVALRTGDGPA